MLLIPTVHHFLFQYVPMYGVLIAFKDYRIGLGILGSDWNGFAHFSNMFNDFLFLRALRNTIIISSLQIVFGFIAPLTLALLLNEITQLRFKRVVQSISYLPHFMSWVIVAGMIVEILSPERGVINYFMVLLGFEPINFLANRVAFIPILILSEVWKSMGWGAIIYLATLSSISPELYEAAEVDGANRFRKMINITIPGLVPVVIILFLLQIGNMLEIGYDQIMNLYNPLVYEVADIIDTYVYRTGLVEFRLDYAAAVGLFKNLVGVVLLITVNQIVRKYSDYGVW